MIFLGKKLKFFFQTRGKLKEARLTKRLENIELECKNIWSFYSSLK